MFGHHSALEPVKEEIAIFPQFVKPTPQTIILKEKVLSVSGDSFEIKTDTDEPVIKVHGAWVSLRGRKKVEDHQGTHLFDIIKEHLHIHTTYALEDPHGKKIAEVKSDLIKLIGSKATATFTDANGKAVKLFMKGGILEHGADIVDEKSNQTVARIDRKILNGRDLIFGQQTYAVVVAPGVDAALIAALCICFDEKNHDEKED